MPASCFLPRRRDRSHPPAAAALIRRTCRESGWCASFAACHDAHRPNSPLLFETIEAPVRISALRPARARDGFWPVAGADEAGRGPLAGPVVAAAVILDPDNIPEGLNDSKQLSVASARGAVRHTSCRSAIGLHRLLGRRAAHRRARISARRASMLCAAPCSRLSKPPCARARRWPRRAAGASLPWQGRRQGRCALACRSPPPRSSPRWPATG